MTNSTDADETDTDENKDSSERGLSERETKYIDRAIELVDESAEIGNTPFKAVTVLNGKVVGEGQFLAERSHDRR